MARPVLLVKSGGEAALPEWQRHFAEAGAAVEVRWWDDPAVDPASVRYVLVWDPEPGRLCRLPELRVIFGSGAGVDFITRDPDLPRHIPLVRMATPGAAQRMGEYVTWAVLSLVKNARRMAIAQAAAAWDYFELEPTAPATTVGIMGLGHMGATAARMLRALGFRVIGWSRTRKEIEGVRSFAGEAERDAFLAAAQVLVCLLPATPETRGILSKPLFDRLRDGTALVNVGRGSQQKLDDIIAALDARKLSAAVLDVFEQEPLPDGHPAWSHPRLTVTPHVASLPPRRERAAHVAQLIAMHERGEALPNTYDHARGY
ncbi:2-hydroxyacid dehydrogenase [Falsiroseomonas sp. HW251]|uniref:2-hydroxyacid dehydrogenase n=1 Tax=Falsiroseomonas sp. HW251 TaxID=3390998 RepID=UPI003D313846